MRTATSAAEHQNKVAQSKNAGSAFFRAEETLVRVNLSDVSLPSVGGLQVDGFKPSWWQRLLGRR